VNGQVGSGVKKFENERENVFFAVGVKWGRGNLGFVEVAERCVSSASGAAVFVDVVQIFWILSINESEDEWINGRTIVYVTGNI
jgi:hypothetical protein